jgi:hypothetical protein
MQRFLIAIILLCIWPAVSQAKKKQRKFFTSDILVASDSLLHVAIGDTLFGYCKLHESSVYTTQKGKKVTTSNFSVTKLLPRSFTKATIFYSFTMPYGECPLYDTVSGLLQLEIQKQDTNFIFTSPPDLSFIPGIAISHAPCNFITAGEAITIAREDTLLAGITAPYADLYYLPSTGQFAWVVLSLLWNERDFHDREQARKDMVVIDAEKATILKHTVIPYTTDVFGYLQP